MQNEKIKINISSRKSQLIIGVIQFLVFCLLLFISYKLFAPQAEAAPVGTQMYADTFDGTELEFNFWDTLDACSTCKRPGDVDRQVHVQLYNPSDTKVYDGGRVHNPYDFQPFVWNTSYSSYWTNFPYWFSTQIGLGTPDTGDYYFQFDIEAWNYGSPSTIESQWYFRMHYSGSVWSIYSAATDGVCGSASGQYADSEPTTNLCSVGTPSSVTYTPYEEWNWSCAGSGGGSTAYCFASASPDYLALQPVQCGTWNYEIHTGSAPTGEQACLEGTITGMAQYPADNWYWTCEKGADVVSCATLPDIPISVPPTLPSDDSISCSISPTDFSTFADCLGSIFRWVFLPHQDTLNDLYAIPQTLKTKVPFGNFYAIADLLKIRSVSPDSNLVFAMDFMGDSITLVDVNAFKSAVGSQVESIYFGLLKAALWFAFLMWVYAQGRNIFSQSDNEK